MMKNVFVNIFILFFTLCIIGCKEPTNEYSGVKIIKITYKTVDFNGGYTDIKVLEFNENKYYSVNYLPSNDEIPDLEYKNTFTETQEKVFIDSCYLNGLFDLNESYQETGIVDGGSWDLIIEYEDGTSKISTGYNAGPYNVFNKCSTCFYDLCGEEVMGLLPNYYTYPPCISYSFRYSIENNNISTNETAQVVLANYKWNKAESININYYEMNEKYKSQNEFTTNYDYKLVLYTANYDCDEKFNKIAVKEYDYNAELSNEKTIYIGKWMKQIELELKLNKIYVYELSFKDGDYVQYTFSTYCNS